MVTNLLLTTLVCAIYLFGRGTAHSAQVDPFSRGPLNNLNCGTNPKDGVGWHQDTPRNSNKPDFRGPRCGVCGDRIWNNTQGKVIVYKTPLNHEYKGKFWPSSIEGIGAKYVMGQTIRVSVAYWNAHWGSAEWRICPDTKLETYNQTCFDTYLLEVVYAIDSLFNPISVTADNVTRRLAVNTGLTGIDLNVTLRLPDNLTCKRCVLQYTYIGNACQMFRTCADISIVPYVQLLKNNATGKCLSAVSNVAEALKLAPCNATDPKQSILSIGALQNSASSTIYFGSNGKCLDVYKSSTSSGAEVINYKCHTRRNPDANQAWSTINVTDTLIQFKVKKSGMCLTYTTKGIRQSTCGKSNTAQLWSIVTTRVSDNYDDDYTIPDMSSGSSSEEDRISGDSNERYGSSSSESEEGS